MSYFRLSGFPSLSKYDTDFLRLSLRQQLVISRECLDKQRVREAIELHVFRIRVCQEEFKLKQGNEAYRFCIEQLKELLMELGLDALPEHIPKRNAKERLR